MPLIPRSNRSVRLWRWVFAALAMLSVCAVVFTQRREIGLHTSSGWFIGLSVGTVQLGWNSARFIDSPNAGFYVRECWERDYTLAWRPFHVADARPPASWDFVVVPLWPAALVFVALTAFCQGVIRGRGWAGSACEQCGYDLRGTRIIDDVQVCPECGTRQKASRTVLPPTLPLSDGEPGKTIAP